MGPIATACWKDFREFTGGFHIELVHNSAMKGDLKSSPIYVLWVVSSKNGTGNNGINRNVSKNGTFLILGFGDLGLSLFNISVPFLPTFPFEPLLPVPFLPKIILGFQLANSSCTHS